MIVGLYGVSLCLLMPSVLGIGGFGELGEECVIAIDKARAIFQTYLLNRIYLQFFDRRGLVFIGRRRRRFDFEDELMFFQRCRTVVIHPPSSLKTEPLLNRLEQ